MELGPEVRKQQIGCRLQLDRRPFAILFLPPREIHQTGPEIVPLPLSLSSQLVRPARTTCPAAPPTAQATGGRTVQSLLTSENDSDEILTLDRPSIIVCYHAKGACAVFRGASYGSCAVLKTPLEGARVQRRPARGFGKR
jgi:hypothetical protein